MTSDTKQATYTPEPWVAEGARIFAADGYEVTATDGVHLHRDHDGNSGHWGSTPGAAKDMPEEAEVELARRMVAEHNACAGLSTEALESGDLAAFLETAANDIDPLLANADLPGPVYVSIAERTRFRQALHALKGGAA